MAAPGDYIRRGAESGLAARGVVHGLLNSVPPISIRRSTTMTLNRRQLLASLTAGLAWGAAGCGDGAKTSAGAAQPGPKTTKKYLNFLAFLLPLLSCVSFVLASLLVEHLEAALAELFP